MHSRIFQISTTRIEKDNYLNEDTLQQGDYGPYDYCAEIDDEERKEDIANLVNYALPKGMFELVGDDTIRYTGGMEQWKEEYVANIRKKAEELTVVNMWQWSTTYYFRQAIQNPLNTDYHFIWTVMDVSPLPSSPLRSCSLSVILTLERYSISEELSTIISDTFMRTSDSHPPPKRAAVSSSCIGCPISFIALPCQASVPVPLPFYSCRTPILTV